MRNVRPILIPVLLLALAGSVTLSSASANSKVLGHHAVTPSKGGEVRTKSGWRLYVPAHVVGRSGTATITRTASHRVNIHINVPWHGPVLVTAPLHNSRDRVAHQLDGLWVGEGGRAGQRSVWVTQLSPFSFTSVLGRVQDALCLSILDGDVPGFIECIAEKGIAYVSGKVISWVASKVSASCNSALIAAGISAGGNKKIPVAVLKSVVLSASCKETASAPGTSQGTGTNPIPNPVNPQGPTYNPQSGTAPPPPQFPVMNTSETLPDGVYFRRSAHTSDTAGTTGLGVFRDDTVALQCYVSGDEVGPHDSLWYYVTNVTRPTVDTSDGTVTNAGYLNAHYIDDKKAANVVDDGVPPC